MEPAHIFELACLVVSSGLEQSSERLAKHAPLEGLVVIVLELQLLADLVKDSSSDPVGFSHGYSFCHSHSFRHCHSAYPAFVLGYVGRFSGRTVVGR